MPQRVLFLRQMSECFGRYFVLPYAANNAGNPSIVAQYLEKKSPFDRFPQLRKSSCMAGIPEASRHMGKIETLIKMRYGFVIVDKSEACIGISAPFARSYPRSFAFFSCIRRCRDKSAAAATGMSAFPSQGEMAEGDGLFPHITMRRIPGSPESFFQCALSGISQRTIQLRPARSSL